KQLTKAHLTIGRAQAVFTLHRLKPVPVVFVTAAEIRAFEAYVARPTEDKYKREVLEDILKLLNQAAQLQYQFDYLDDKKKFFSMQTFLNRKYLSVLERQEMSIDEIEDKVLAAARIDSYMSTTPTKN